MCKYLALSDLHIGSYGSNYEKALPILHDPTFRGDVILLGDIYDSYISANSDKFDLLFYIRRNPNVGNIYYIPGNHDPYPIIPNEYNVQILEALTICDGAVKLIHGHQYDPLAKIHKGKYSSLSARLKEYIGNKFNINIKCVANFFFGGIIKIYMSYVVKRAMGDAKEDSTTQILIMGHTHIAEEMDNYYNTGSFVDGNASYIEIEEKENSLEINLIKI
jgi:UDP-2,3-diacylglucosamine pyrophosphatase LpxH